MDEQPPLKRQVIGPNPKHRRDRVRQIWLPFGLFGLVILGVMVFLIVMSASGTANEAAETAAIALICLILPAMVLTLVFLALTGGLAVLTTLGIRRSPPFFYKIHHLLQRVHNGVNTASEKATSIVTRLPTSRAGWQRLVQMLFRRNSAAG